MDRCLVHPDDHLHGIPCVDALISSVTTGRIFRRSSPRISETAGCSSLSQGSCQRWASRSSSRSPLPMARWRRSVVRSSGSNRMATSVAGPASRSRSWERASSPHQSSSDRRICPRRSRDGQADRAGAGRGASHRRHHLGVVSSGLRPTLEPRSRNDLLCLLIALTPSMSALGDLAAAGQIRRQIFQSLVRGRARSASESL